MDMDFTIPLTSSPNFTDLLFSQQGINTPNSFSQPPSPSNETTLGQTSKDAVAKHRWTVPEEKVLVCAWLNTSKDPIVGNEQRAGTFWERVAHYYSCSRTVANLPKREPNTYKQKWSKINESVSKFAGCIETAERMKKSGQNENDVIGLAFQLYFQDQKMKFNMEHAWRLLKDDQKWCLLKTESRSSSKRAKVSESGNFSASSVAGLPVEEKTEERPMGVKAAKAKGKKRVRAPETEDTYSGSVKMLEELWVIKEKDIAGKALESDKKILACLLSKTEPLTEIEMTLKKNLILDML